MHLRRDRGVRDNATWVDLHHPLHRQPLQRVTPACGPILNAYRAAASRFAPSTTLLSTQTRPRSVSTAIPSGQRKKRPRDHYHSAHDAAHQPWEYRRAAALWTPDGVPLIANLSASASEMHAWLTGRVGGISEPLVLRTAELEAQRNPYSVGLTTLAVSYATVINDSVSFIESDDSVEPMDAEIRRIRLEAELVLYAARFCEAAIKQMLHCTNFPARFYKNAAMGSLLEQDCKACRAARQPSHAFSLLGSLAHQYMLCFEIDNCALDHLLLANQRRNVEVAHANAPALLDCNAAHSKRLLKKKLDSVGGDFVHLLSHLMKIEAAMIREIELRIRYHPQMPPRDVYNTFLTRTAIDYDREGVYRGHGYGLERMRQLREAETHNQIDRA